MVSLLSIEGIVICGRSHSLSVLAVAAEVYRIHNIDMAAAADIKSNRSVRNISAKSRRLAKHEVTRARGIYHIIPSIL